VRSNRDYVTLSGVCKRTGATENELTVFLLKEIINNAIDFIEANSSSSSSSSSSNYASDNAQPTIYVDIKYDQDKTAPVLASSNVELCMYKTGGVTDFDT
jgi:hypothetical protein